MDRRDTPTGDRRRGTGEIKIGRVEEWKDGRDDDWYIGKLGNWWER
jgi:hypothetical protein